MKMIAYPIFMLLATIIFPQASWARKIAVIANDELTAPQGITAVDVKSVYTGKSQFINGEKILLTETRQKPLFEIFVGSILKMSEASYRTLWLRKVFAEGGIAPRQVETCRELIKFVSENKKAVGFAWLDEIESQDRAGVKVLLTLDAGNAQGAP